MLALVIAVLFAAVVYWLALAVGLPGVVALVGAIVALLGLGAGSGRWPRA